MLIQLALESMPQQVDISVIRDLSYALCKSPIALKI